MKIKIFKKPRIFSVNKINIKDFGKIRLEQNEMISFITKTKKEYDFTAKDCGFYVSPSINGRLKNEGFKIALVKNKLGKFYVMAVEKEKINIFKTFCLSENKKIIKWLG